MSINPPRARRNDHARFRREACEWLLAAGVDGELVEQFFLADAAYAADAAAYAADAEAADAYSDAGAASAASADAAAIWRGARLLHLRRYSMKDGTPPWPNAVEDFDRTKLRVGIQAWLTDDEFSACEIAWGEGALRLARYYRADAVEGRGSWTGTITYEGWAMVDDAVRSVFGVPVEGDPESLGYCVVPGR